MSNANDPPEPIRVNLGYALTELQKALRAAGGDTSPRVRKWQDVLSGILSGSLHIGSRTPVVDTPPWVTLEVVHGGFATGSFAAAGPLQPHELERLSLLPATPSGAERGALNLYFVSDAGRAELGAVLDSGSFRVHYPEEAALLIAQWLIERQEGKRAQALINVIAPYFDRLRFYPVPHPVPMRTGDSVYVQTVGETTRSLQAVRVQPSLQKMREALTFWAPLYDHAVRLFDETVEGDRPFLRTDATGALLRAPNGQPIVAGGWPCRSYAEDWPRRVESLLREYQELRAQNSLCRKPEKPKENFARLRAYLAACVRDPTALTGRDVGMIRHILASHRFRHGEPDGEALKAKRAHQLRDVAAPAHHEVAGLIARRLTPFPTDEGLLDVSGVSEPLSAEEAASIHAESGTAIPVAIVRKATRCLEAPIPSLVAAGLISSSEVLAWVLPLLTARLRARAVEDVPLRGVYEAAYLAFRRRRSLLLLDLERQVSLGELPWIAAVEPWVGSDQAARDAARATLDLVVRLSLDYFPQTIFPNRLLKELRTLAAGAGLSLPLVDELAADIFMGAFSGTYLRAAQSAARLMRGSLYARYFGIPSDRVLAIDDVSKDRFQTATSAGFARLCEELAGESMSARPRWSVARNGKIIEQAQILTTHNLAVLWEGFGMSASMQDRLPDLARRCFQWICERQQIPNREWHARLQMVKNTAYAWRQMIFFLSFLSPGDVANFCKRSSEHAGAQSPDFQRRFEPALSGLIAVSTGAEFDRDGRHAASGGRRFLGWTTGEHWLLDPAEAIEPLSGS